MIALSIMRQLSKSTNILSTLGFKQSPTSIKAYTDVRLINIYSHNIVIRSYFAASAANSWRPAKPTTSILHSSTNRSRLLLVFDVFNKSNCLSTTTTTTNSTNNKIVSIIDRRTSSDSTKAAKLTSTNSSQKTDEQLKDGMDQSSSNNFRMDDEERRQWSRSVVGYILGTVILFIGLTYAAVPAYKLFCQSTSLGGSVKGPHLVKDSDKIDSMRVVKKRLIRICFESDVGARMAWEFKPQQFDIYVHPGETALVFYTATNPSDKPIVGISTYNVVPYEAGRYFSKIQCFCFEEQLLNPGEELDMPVFFYIDPDFADDPQLELVDEIVLSYTFFESKHGLSLPQPGFLQQQQRQTNKTAAYSHGVVEPSKEDVNNIDNTTTIQQMGSSSSKPDAFSTLATKAADVLQQAKTPELAKTEL